MGSGTCWVLALGCSLGVVVSACGSSSGAPAGLAGAGAGGASGASGGTVSSAGSTTSGGTSSAAGAPNAGAAGYVLGDSLTEACIKYALAGCTRNTECQGASDRNCWMATLDCPDVVTSTGSTRTAASLSACAADYAVFPCADLLAGKLPSCVTPGTRQTDDACAFASQCSSLSCKIASESGCGVCASLVDEGADCSALNVDCADGMYCDNIQTPARCVKHTEGSGSAPDVGQACTPSRGCKAGNSCDSVSKLCKPYPGLDMSCEELRSCSSDVYCELQGLVCKARPALGAACGVDGFTGEAAYCAEGLLCKRVSKALGTCQQPPAVGEPCLLDLETQMPVLNSCGSSNYCDASQTPPVCAAPGGPGQACSGDDNSCQSGFNCACPGFQGPCSATTCLAMRFGNQRCDELGVACHPGFSCTQGVCIPRDSRGKFAEVCAP